MEHEQQVKVDTLAVGSRSWDGAELPPYPAGKPEISILRYTIPAHKRLGVHLHNIINCGVVTKGELTVVATDGTEHTWYAGEAIVEMLGKPHYGENRGDTPTELIMVYAGSPGMPLKQDVPQP